MVAAVSGGSAERRLLLLRDHLRVGGLVAEVYALGRKGGPCLRLRMGQGDARAELCYRKGRKAGFVIAAANAGAMVEQARALLESFVAGHRSWRERGLGLFAGRGLALLEALGEAPWSPVESPMDPQGRPAFVAWRSGRRSEVACLSASWRPRDEGGDFLALLDGAVVSLTELDARRSLPSQRSARAGESSTEGMAEGRLLLLDFAVAGAEIGAELAGEAAVMLGEAAATVGVVAAEAAVNESVGCLGDVACGALDIGGCELVEACACLG